MKQTECVLAKHARTKFLIIFSYVCYGNNSNSSTVCMPNWYTTNLHRNQNSTPNIWLWIFFIRIRVELFFSFALGNVKWLMCLSTSSKNCSKHISHIPHFLLYFSVALYSHSHIPMFQFKKKVTQKIEGKNENCWLVNGSNRKYT